MIHDKVFSLFSFVEFALVSDPMFNCSISQAEWLESPEKLRADYFEKKLLFVGVMVHI